ncbi:putative ABC transport system permease protein [Clostridium punense]|uniref:ABC transport system permease protein n=1 Tax=Clostridium punense TaxID=1054297 RepID=A0ABS4JYL5_9CLOT|nr:ABC transporter permease [Clostridium punense]MBP2020622.1 putative ABC transport system permease protein [Clostridium punense]
MSIIDLLKTSVYSMKSHKLRVFLTMIGIIIGISSVVTILSIGNGLKAEVNKSVEDTNSNKINVYFQPENMGADMTLMEPFEEADIYSLQKIEGVQKIEKSKNAFAGFSFSTAQANYFDKNVMLVLSEYKNQKLNVEYGRSIKPEEKSRKLIVLDKANAKQLFDTPENAVGRGITLNGVTHEVVGVLKEETGFSLTGGGSYVSKESLEDMSADTAISSIDVYVKPDADREKVLTEVKKELALSHPNLKGKYETQDPQAITKAFEKIIGGLTTFVALVTGISLFVGGIGVMNIMYVSVSERKREIGIRRAIGGKPRSILLQFLFEAIMVTGTGGLIGILCGYLFGKLAGLFMPFKPVLTVGSFAGATITSVIVGIVFGIIPAYNASRLDPIKAIYK